MESFDFTGYQTGSLALVFCNSTDPASLCFLHLVFDGFSETIQPDTVQIISGIQRQ
ncbi:hypothetical protein ACFQGE_14940 [Halomicroarcula sp. GCM10025817]|uniref:hypothetical protein n=1 Tax=Haloarcula TaxID=2237 RepID=UPI0023E7897D|nr:hypothetical protein [Halomicroarcula sp. SYNS111]